MNGRARASGLTNRLGEQGHANDGHERRAEQNY